MKRTPSASSRVLLLGAILGAAIICNAQNNDATPPTASTAAAPDALATARAFQTAMTRGDAAAVRKHLDPQVLIMEGGNVEQSLSEYAAHHLPADLKYMSSVNYTLLKQTGKTMVDLAWVASEAELSPKNGDASAAKTRTAETLVLRKDGQAWKIIHIHWSSRKLNANS